MVVASIGITILILVYKFLQATKGTAVKFAAARHVSAIGMKSEGNWQLIIDNWQLTIVLPFIPMFNHRLTKSKPLVWKFNPPKSSPVFTAFSILLTKNISSLMMTGASWGPLETWNQHGWKSTGEIFPWLNIETKKDNFALAILSPFAFFLS